MTWDVSRLSSARDFRGILHRTHSSGSRMLLPLRSSMRLWVSPANTAEDDPLNLAKLHPDILETNGIAWPNPQMWRRQQSNPALPVPTYYPDDGADSHSHSPRRRSYVGHSTTPSSVPMPAIPTASAAPSAMTPTLNFHGFQKSSASSGSSFMDPFSEAAYQEWINSLGLNQQQPNLDAKVVWPSVNSRSDSKQSSTDHSIPSMSDYLPSTMGHTMAPNSMHISGASLDDDAQMANTKVPTNTPTLFPGGDLLASGALAREV